MASLKTELGSVKLPALNRERLIEFGRKRAKTPILFAEGYSGKAPVSSVLYASSNTVDSLT